MADCRPLSVSISMGTKILVNQSPTTTTKIRDMDSNPYASTIVSLLYYGLY